MKAKKGEVIHKLKIARGQIDGILQMIEEDRYCVDISNQLQATQALLKSANQQILQAHIRNCVREALQTEIGGSIKSVGEDGTMMPEGREKKGFSALNSSDWIVISSFGSVQNKPNFIYFRWLDMANKQGGNSDETVT